MNIITRSLFTILLLINSLRAQEIVYEVVPQSMPKEYSVLFNFYWENHLSILFAQDTTAGKKWLQVNNSMFSRIPKDKLFILCQTEIFKFVLTQKGDVSVPSFFNKSIIPQFQIFIETNKAELSSFEKFILIGLYNDLEDLFESPFYPTLQLQLKSFQPIKSIDLHMLKKKLVTIIQVVTHIMMLEDVERKVFFKKAAAKIINNISLKAKFFTTFSSFNNSKESASSNYTFFRKKDEEHGLISIVDLAIEDLKNKPAKIEHSVKTQETLPISSKINWDDVPLIPTPFPSYKIPESLPKPLNDWIQNSPSASPNNLLIFPTPDPNYQVPENLPIPLAAPGIWPEE